MTDTSKEALDALVEEKNDNPDWESVGFAESYVNRLLETIEALRREWDEAERRVAEAQSREAAAVQDKIAARNVTREQVINAMTKVEWLYPEKYELAVKWVEALGLTIQDSEPQCSASWDGEECHADDCPKKPGAACPRRPFDYPSDTDSEPGRDMVIDRLEAENARLREALELFKRCHDWPVFSMDKVRGVARAALKESE